MADQVDDTTIGVDPAVQAEADRVRAAAGGNPTIVVDEPTGAPEGEGAAAQVPEPGPSPAPEPAPAPAPAPETPPEAPAAAAPAEPASEEQTHSVAQRLVDLSQRELERLGTAIEHALRGKGSEPEKQGPTLTELASRLPVNEVATAAVNAAQAAAKFEGVEPGDLLSWKVRQDQDAEGNPTGPAYLRVVTRQGQKLTTILS